MSLEEFYFLEENFMHTLVKVDVRWNFNKFRLPPVMTGELIALQCLSLSLDVGICLRNMCLKVIKCFNRINYEANSLDFKNCHHKK